MRINKPYVLTARAKGLTENQVLYKHVFRNAMLIVVAGFPTLLIKMLFTGSLLIEVIFSLNGLGLLGYEAIMTRDYPVIFGTLYIFALLGLLLKLLSDITYSLVDPRCFSSVNARLLGRQAAPETALPNLKHNRVISPCSSFSRGSFNSSNRLFI